MPAAGGLFVDPNQGVTSADELILLYVRCRYSDLLRVWRADGPHPNCLGVASKRFGIFQMRVMWSFGRARAFIDGRPVRIPVEANCCRRAGGQQYIDDSNSGGCDFVNCFCGNESLADIAEAARTCVR
jgi:hypothetical protein